MEEKSGKNVELLSEEVQEVMNHIPSAIVRWGMTVMAVIVAAILIGTAFIRWPKTIECPFEGQQIGDKVVLKTNMSSETLNYLLHTNNKSVCIFSPMFQQQYSSNGVGGNITQISISSYSNNEYSTNLTVILNKCNLGIDTIFYGDIQFIVSDKTLLQLIVKSVKP